jgi:hypothetical protein
MDTGIVQLSSPELAVFNRLGADLDQEPEMNPVISPILGVAEVVLTCKNAKAKRCQPMPDRDSWHTWSFCAIAEAILRIAVKSSSNSQYGGMV